MQQTKKKYGVIKVLSPAIAFIVLDKPRYAHLVKPDFDLDVDQRHIEELLRLELVKRTFSDTNHLNLYLEDYEKLVAECTPDQKVILEDNIISIDRFKRAGFSRIDKAFLDYLGRTNTSPSSRHVPTSNRHMALQEDPHQDNDYMVTMDERTLLAYLFPTSSKNIDSALDCVQKLIDMNQSVTYRNLQRLGELFGVESDPLWQALLRSLGKEGVSPRDQKQFTSDQLREALENARQAIKDKHTMLASIGSFAQLAWEQDEKERVKQEEEQRRAEEEARIAREAEEQKAKEEKERLEREAVKKQIAVAMQAARKKAAEEEQARAMELLRAKFIDE